MRPPPCLRAFLRPPKQAGHYLGELLDTRWLACACHQGQHLPRLAVRLPTSTGFSYSARRITERISWPWFKRRRSTPAGQRFQHPFRPSAPHPVPTSRQPLGGEDTVYGSAGSPSVGGDLFVMRRRQVGGDKAHGGRDKHRSRAGTGRRRRAVFDRLSCFEIKAAILASRAG